MDSLVKIDGKPFEKLIEVVSNGIGTLYRPRAMRKEANAKAYEIKVIEKAKAEALAESKLVEVENLDRINERLLAKEIKRQNNIDDVVEIAANHLKGVPTVTEEIVNEDWTARFFDIAQDVSDDEMKKLWGQILAGEVKAPQSYSLRTLELLRNLTKYEANTFVKVAQLAMLQNGDNFLFAGAADDLSKYDVTFDDIAILGEVGIVQPGSLIQRTLTANKIRGTEIIAYGEIAILLSINANSGVRLPIYRFTQAGTELLRLIDVVSNMEYAKELASYIEMQNANVQYSKDISIRNGKINYYPPLLNF